MAGTQIFSFPFRLTGNGRLATVEQDSEDHLAEEIAIIVLSRPGERPLVPGFGIDDPAFDTLTVEEVSAAIDTYEIPAEIKALASTPRDDTVVDVVIEFDGISLDGEP